MSSADYERMIHGRMRGPGLPFLASVDLGVVSRELPIESYVNAVDGAVLDHMVHGHLLGLLAHLSKRAHGCSIVDYGTGLECGLYSRQLAPIYENAGIDVRRIRFVGIDKFLKPANSVFPDAKYLKTDLAKFPSDQRFDMISAHHVLEHIREWPTLLASASRVLVPGGYAFLSFPTFGGFYDVVYRLLTKEDHVATFELEEIIDRAADVGLELALAVPYADARMRFFWLPNIEKAVSTELQSAVYDLCVFLTARTRLLFHHYGHYLIFRRV